MSYKTSNKSVRGEDFVVTVLDSHKLEYVEGEKVAIIEIEGGMTKPPTVDWFVYGQTFRGWLAPTRARRNHRRRAQAGPCKCQRSSLSVRDATHNSRRITRERERQYNPESKRLSFLQTLICDRQPNRHPERSEGSLFLVGFSCF